MATHSTRICIRTLEKHDPLFSQSAKNGKVQESQKYVANTKTFDPFYIILIILSNIDIKIFSKILAFVKKIKIQSAVIT